MSEQSKVDTEMAVPRDDPASFASGVRRRRPPVAITPFAGRIGGNQEFVIEQVDCAESAEILKKTPDAAPLLTLRDSLNPAGFLNLDTWRQGLIEGWGTCLLVFLFGAAASGLTSLGMNPMASTLYAALVNWIGLSIFIFSAAPASGGHLNPSITIATFFAGLATLPRAVIYVVAQVTGAIVGGYWLRLGLGDAYFPTGVIPGCTIDTTLCSVGQMWVLEYMFSQILIFTAFGVGLDPRQANVFGPALAPILVGTTLALATLASSIAKPGYTGMSFNAARCTGLMAGKDFWQYHWVHWTGPIAAAMVNGIFYHIAPPYRKNKPMVQQNPLNSTRTR